MNEVAITRGAGSPHLRLLPRLGGFLALLLLGACGSPRAGSSETVALGTYYAQFGVRIEKETCRSTNYRWGEGATLIPVNDKVELLRTRGDRFYMRLADGREFTFEHVARHTKNTAAEAFAAFFGTLPIDLTVFSGDERGAVESSHIREGMSRRAVLAAIGPPPAMGTPSLESTLR